MSDPSAKRRFWGWGVEGEGPTREQQAKMGQTIAARFGAAPGEPIEPPTIAEIELREPRVAPPAPLALALHDRSRRTRRAHLRQVVPRHLARPAPRLRAACPTSWPSRATENDIVALLDWCSDAQRRRDPVRRRFVGRRRRRVRHRRRLPRRDQHRPARARPGARDRPRVRARRASRPASSGPRSKTSSARTASRCATSRSRSSSRRSAAGSRRAPAVTTRRCTRTSTTSSESIRAVTPRGAVGEPAAARLRAPGRRPTACSSARRARSASSPKRGCASRTGRRSARR